MKNICDYSYKKLVFLLSSKDPSEEQKKTHITDFCLIVIFIWMNNQEKNHCKL